MNCLKESWKGSLIFFPFICCVTVLPSVSHYRCTTRGSYLVYLLFVGFGTLFVSKVSKGVILRSHEHVVVIWLIDWLIVFAYFRGALSRMPHFDKFSWIFLRLSFPIHLSHSHSQPSLRLFGLTFTSIVFLFQVVCSPIILRLPSFWRLFYTS